MTSATNERPFTNHAFQQMLAEHKLMGARCAQCGQLYVPPRPLCTACYSDQMEWVALSGKGNLVAFTTVHIAPTAMIEAGYGRSNPYCAGIVALEEGANISAQILGVDAAQPQQIAIGTPLQVTFIERGEGEEQRTYLAFERQEE